VQENVGGVDLAIRSVVGPALMVAAFRPLGARNGRWAGLAALVSGALVTESAITRTCPLNALLRIDTR
jgi:hypothetical protein